MELPLGLEHFIDRIVMPRPNAYYVGSFTGFINVGTDGTIQQSEFMTSDGFKNFSDKAKVGDEIILVGVYANIHDARNGKHGTGNSWCQEVHPESHSVES